MRIRQKLMTMLAALLIMSAGFPVFAVKADSLPEKTTQDNIPVSMTEDLKSEKPTEEATQDNIPAPDEDASKDEDAPTTDETLPQEMTATAEEEADIPVPEEAPMFTAHIEYSSQGYLVKGSFTDFTPDICHVQPLYSLDGETWQTCGVEWDLRWLGTEDEDKQRLLQNQICLYDSYEPLKSYLSGTLDQFRLKLQLTRKNGLTYESQTAVIDRGEPQPIPEGIIPVATFAPSMRLLEKNPFRVYGKYQITINAAYSLEDITAFLPDTLPVEIQLQPQNDINHTAICTIDCPVTWLPLSVPLPAAGESVTIPDAAEKIVVPGGTLLNTPLGIFRLDEPLSLEQDDIHTDEVRLVLNAVPEHGNPTGVLAVDRNMLEMSFHLKPTGATAIRIYTFSEGDSKWTEILGHSLLEAVNAQPSTANSSYACVLDSSQEPYQSYLAAEADGNDPAPFFVGVKIEGGVYNGRQLVLTWPDTYDLPPDLPDVGGSGGNQGNAGAGNKDDSTDEGQRPNLPQSQENEPDLPQSRQAETDTASIPDTAVSDTEYTDESPGNPFVETQTPADLHINIEEKSPAAVPAINAESDIPAETTVPSDPPAKPRASDTLPTPDKSDRTGISEKPDRHDKSDYHNYFLPVTAAAIAGICLALSAYRASGRNHQK